MIHIITTAANIDKDYDNRKRQYLKGLESIIQNYEINPLIIETCNRTDYLSEHYNGESNYSANKGINEFINIRNFIGESHSRFHDNDDVIKITLRYAVTSSYFLDFIKNNDYDAYCKPSTDMYGCNDRGVHTFLFAMKYKYWRAFFLTEFDYETPDPIEWKIAEYVRNLNTHYMDKLDILAAPDGSGKVFAV